MFEETEQLQYQLVANDKDPLSAQKLIEFKAIISKALPNMEKSHIIRLLFDPRHVSLIMFKGDQMVGGTCFACFSELGFVELAFLAVKADKRVQGYGKKIMNKTKSVVQQKNIQYIITYGDNMALGFFRKQGFSEKITMPKTQWEGFIKEYDGGKLMECKIHPTVDYMQIDRIIAMQKMFIRRMVKNASTNEVRFEGSKIEDNFEGGCRRGEKNDEYFIRDPRKIPGVIEAGWKWEEHDEIKKYIIDPFQTRCMKLIESIKRHPESKYFYDPISPAEVPKYHEVIKNPMSLSVISEKIHQNLYQNEQSICEDIELIFSNCRTFNSETSVYYKSSDKLKIIIQPEILAFKNGMILTSPEKSKKTDELTN